MSKENSLDNSLKLIAKTSLIVFLGLVISKICLYAYRVIIAREFGPETYGIFSLALMILNLFVAIATLGLSDGVSRFIPFYRGKKELSKIKYLFNLSRNISLISSIIFAVILFFTSDFISINIFHNPNLSIFLKISSIILPFYVLSGIYLSAIRSFELVGWYSFILNIFQNIIKLIGLIALVLLGFKSSDIMYSFLIGILVMFLFSYYIFKIKISRFILGSPDGKSKSLIRTELFKYSLPLMFASVFSIIYYWIDSFAIGYLNNVTDVGFYNSVVPIALLLNFIPDLFIQMFYPLITKEYSNKNFKVIGELSKQVSKWIFILALPLFFIMFLFPGAVINILFGSDYLIAANTLRILSVGGLISILTGFLTTLLSMAGKSKTIFLNLLITSGLNLILNLILIPIYGINGAAIATTLIWILLTIILFIQVKLALNLIPLRRKLIRVFLVSLIPLAVLVFIKSFFEINFIILASLGILFFILYIITIILTGCLDKNDKMIIEAFKQKISYLSTAVYEKFI